MTFTERLREMVIAEMKRRGLSARSMALRLDVENSTVSRWLSGERGIRSQNIDRIVDYLGPERVIEALHRQSLERNQPAPPVRRVA